MICDAIPTNGLLILLVPLLVLLLLLLLLSYQLLLLLLLPVATAAACFFFCCLLVCLAWQDWWNSRTFSVFYRKWNGVVHDWIHAYLYTDLVGALHGCYSVWLV